MAGAQRRDGGGRDELQPEAAVDEQREDLVLAAGVRLGARDAPVDANVVSGARVVAGRGERGRVVDADERAEQRKPVGDGHKLRLGAGDVRLRRSSIDCGSSVCCCVYSIFSAGSDAGAGAEGDVSGQGAADVGWG